ncbi:MAG: hypothetical protein EOM24_02525 [Chloroflexia bacterium]|nr:hypothetical protein [Chloroflexia bacterium]
MTQRIDDLRAELAELDEELAATTHPRTRARLEADRAAVVEALATLVAAHAAQPGQFSVHQAGQTGGVSFGAGNTFHGAVQIGDLISGDTVTSPVNLFAYLRATVPAEARHIVTGGDPGHARPARRTARGLGYGAINAVSPSERRSVHRERRGGRCLKGVPCANSATPMDCHRSTG